MTTIIWLTEPWRITPEYCKLIGYISCCWTKYFAVLVQLFPWPEWALLMGGVIVTKDSTDVASCYFTAKASWYDWRWAPRERFGDLLSNDFRPELLPSLSIEEAIVLGYIVDTSLHFLGQAVEENIQFLTSVLLDMNQIFSCTALPLVQ